MPYTQEMSYDVSWAFSNFFFLSFHFYTTYSFFLDNTLVLWHPPPIDDGDDNGRTRGVMRRTPKRRCTTSLGHVAELSYSNIIDDFNIHVLSGDTQSWPPTLSTLHCTYLRTIAHLRHRLVNSDPPILQSSAPLLLLVSASPVAWTEKKPKPDWTQPNATGPPVAVALILDFFGCRSHSLGNTVWEIQ